MAQTVLCVCARACAHLIKMQLCFLQHGVCVCVSLCVSVFKKVEDAVQQLSAISLTNQAPPAAPARRD